MASFAISSAASLNVSNTTFSGINFTVGELNRTYTLYANVSANSPTVEPAINISIKFIMPYGVVPLNSTGALNIVNTCTGAANFSLHNATHMVCEINYTHTARENITDTIGHRLYALNVTTNMSAFAMYGTNIFNYTVNCGNCSGINSTIVEFYAGNYFRNPRPSVTSFASNNATLRILQWNQTDKGYQLMAPLETYNDTLKRPVLANNTFAEIMYFDKSFFEFPSYMRLYSYNLTFTLVYTGSVTNASFTLKSPINNSAFTNQTLYPLLIHTQVVEDFHSNATRNFTMGIPNPSDFTVFFNGTNYTTSQLLQQKAINITFNTGMSGIDQSIQLLTINLSTINQTLLNDTNNTQITVFFTVMDTSNSRMVSPVYVLSQEQTGWGMNEPPAFGETKTMSTVVNVTNVLWNYTLDNASVSFMVPMNVTMLNTDYSTFKQFNMTQDANITLWNGTTWRNATDSGVSIVKRESVVNFTEAFGGTDKIIIIHVTTWDVVLTSNNTHATLRNWTPTSNSAQQPWARINFSAQITFPIMSESDGAAGAEGNNSYNVTTQLSSSAPINLTTKLDGLNSANCGSTGADCGLSVTIDGMPYTSNNYTFGSLVLNNVPSGTHTISVSYVIPSTSSDSSSSSSSSSGGGGSKLNPKTSKSWTSLPSGVTKLNIDDAGIGMKSIDIQVANQVSNVRINIEKLAAKPSSIAKEIAGSVFQYIEITKENINDSNIQSATIKFNVSKSWLADNVYRKEDVVLMRYTTAWDELTPTIISESSSEVELTAQSPGFSTFAIAARNTSRATTTATTTTTMPDVVTTTTTTTLPDEPPLPPNYPLLAMAGFLIAALAVYAYRHKLEGKNTKKKE
ncbi:MAG: PGF-pre-PGF domain-containing protein [Candidatus Aenigmarchaeota archaeon]|nr:PGF-pre-PGF domain-containing protein [Candidatus Aenigmarchaeota archaeon]